MTVDPAAGPAFVDRIDFSVIDAMANTAGSQAFSFIGGAAFSGEGQVRAFQSGTRTIVQVSTDGAAGAEMEIALLEFSSAALSAADFIL